MTPVPLKVGAIGLNEQVESLLELALKDERFSISAVADEDASRAQSAARRYECAQFDDFRRLIMQNQLDVLFVGAPIHSCIDHLRLALQKKFHILKTTPAAMNFGQYAELVGLARKEGVHFVPVLPGRFEPMLERLRSELSRSEAESWHLITAVCHIPAGPFPAESRWLYDPQLAGGGVLMWNAYDLIDEIVLSFGLPQQVYALLANQAPDRQQRMSLTEDTAIVSLRFSDALIAQVCASRTLGPARRHLRIHGKERFLTLTRDDFLVCDHQGNVTEHVVFGPERIHGLKDLLENFASAVLEPGQCKLWPGSEADLKTMAVVESAYLSARTAMPEAPPRLLELARAGAAGLW